MQEIKIIRFREAFIAQLIHTGMTIPDVSRRSGVSADLLNKLKQRKALSTTVENAVNVAKCFGMTVNEFIDDGPDARMHELQRLFALLNDQEKSFLTLQIKGLVERRD